MDFQRQDGRKANELRKIQLESGHLEVDGSAKFSIGASVVETSIVGPVTSMKHCDHHKITEAHIDVTVQSEQGTITSLEMYLKQQILSIFSNTIFLEKYPNTTIYIQCQVICDASCLLMALLNSVSIALLDSGIDCKTFPVSVSFGIFDDDTKETMLVFDPSDKESEMLQSFGTLSYSTSLSKVTPNINAKDTHLITGKFKRQRKKSKSENNDSSNIDSGKMNDNEVNDMDLIYTDIKGKFNMKMLKEILKECKVACYTLQFFIKRHFVQMMINLPSIYVQQVKE